jgi:hypothetical protein
MATVYTEVEVDVSLDDFDTDDLLDELASRGKSFSVPGTLPSELVSKIYELRRLGKNFEQELDELIYIVTGRAV